MDNQHPNSFEEGQQLLRDYLVDVIVASRKSKALAEALGEVFKKPTPASPPRDPYKTYEKLHRIYPSGATRKDLNSSSEWILFSNDWANTILGDKKHFSAARFTKLESEPPYSKLKKENLELINRMFINLDGQEHSQLRTAVAEPFRRSAVTGKQKTIDQIAHELFEDLDWSQPVNLVKDFAKQLPNQVIAEVLGYTADYKKLQELSDYIANILEPFEGFDPERMDEVIDTFRKITKKLVESSTDPNSFLGALAEKVSTKEITEDDLTSTVVLLIVGGYETTSSMLGNAIVALDNHPEQKKDLREKIQILEKRDPESAEYLEAQEYLKNAINELLRYDSSVQTTTRIVTEDHTQEVNRETYHFKEGEMVVLFLGAANRDPQVYGNDANTLNLKRENIKNHSFGHGVHACIGSVLAKMELEAGLKKLYGSGAPNFHLTNETLAASSIIRRRSSIIAEKTPVNQPAKVGGSSL